SCSSSKAGAFAGAAVRIRLGLRWKSPSTSALTRTMRSDTSCRRTSAACASAGRTITPSPWRSTLCASACNGTSAATTDIASSVRPACLGLLFCIISTPLPCGAWKRRRRLQSVGRQLHPQQLGGVGKIEAVIGLVPVPASAELPLPVHVGALVHVLVYLA